MNKLRSLMMGMAVVLLTGLAGEAPAEVIDKFRTEGLTAYAYFHDSPGCAQGGGTLYKVVGRDDYWVHINLTKLGYGYTAGSGYIPASAVSKTAHGGWRVQFNSAELSSDLFKGYPSNQPFVVDVTFTPDGNRSEKTVGLTILRDGLLMTHTNGIRESTTAKMSGEINGYFLPETYNGYGYIGENKGMTVQVETNDSPE